MEYSYELMYDGLRYVIEIYRSVDHYFFEIDYEGLVTLGDSHTIVYDTPFEALYAGITKACNNDQIAIKKLIREIKLDELIP